VLLFLLFFFGCIKLVVESFSDEYSQSILNKIPSTVKLVLNSHSVKKPSGSLRQVLAKCNLTTGDGQMKIKSNAENSCGSFLYYF